MTHTMTRLRLNRRDGMRATRTVNATHGLIAALYDKQPGCPHPLWRAETSPQGQTSLLIVTDQTLGDTEHIGDVEQRDYQRLLDRLTPGDHYRFRIVANPTITSRKEPDTKRGKVSPIIDPVAQLAWLTTQLSAAGATNISGRVINSTTCHVMGFTRSGESRDPSKRVVQVTYEGTLTVADPARLRAALTRGIGRARAYGCGLLTLAAA